MSNTATEPRHRLDTRPAGSDPQRRDPHSRSELPGGEHVKYDVVNAIIAYEAGALEPAGQLELFAHLIKTETVWQLQGSYGRTAANLVSLGYITPEGELTALGQEVADA